MSENVVLLNSDKEILHGNRDESDFKDYSTRKSQIRTRVRNRGKAIAAELDLLEEAGETEVAEDLLSSILRHTDLLDQADWEKKLERIESDIQRIEKGCSEVEKLKLELEDVKRQMDNREI